MLYLGAIRQKFSDHFFIIEEFPLKLKHIFFFSQCQKYNNNLKAINLDLLAVCFSPGEIMTMLSDKEEKEERVI